MTKPTLIPFRFAASSVIAAVLFLGVTAARAEVVFRGDFETGDFSQWTGTLKPVGLSIVTTPVLQGSKACQVRITKNELWSNGLNRVEVQYLPPAKYTAEGAELYYGFSFYLPEALTADNHQVIYWETTETYQQVLQVAIEGQKMSFATQKPSFKRHWQADGIATPGQWHRVAMRVKWSADANVGGADLWVDGQQVVNGAKAVTYLGKPAFTQHGILRTTIDKVETMVMDDARMGTKLEDVTTVVSSGGGGGGGGGGSARPGTGGIGGGTSGSGGAVANSGGISGSAGGGSGGLSGSGGANTGGATVPAPDAGVGGDTNSSGGHPAAMNTGGAGTSSLGGQGGSPAPGGSGQSGCSLAPNRPDDRPLNVLGLPTSVLLIAGFRRHRRPRSDLSRE